MPKTYLSIAVIKVSFKYIQRDVTCVIAMATDKKRTSIYVDEKIWNDWMHFVIDAYGSSRKASEALEDAMKDFMQKKKKG